MQRFRPLRPFVATSALVALLLAVAVTGGWQTGPVRAGLLFLGVGVALPEAYLVRTERPVLPRRATERGLLVALTVCGYAVGSAASARPTLVGVAALVGALAAETIATGRRDPVPEPTVGVSH